MFLYFLLVPDTVCTEWVLYLDLFIQSYVVYLSIYLMFRRIVVCVLQVSGGPWVRKMFRRNLQPSLKDSFGDIPLEESQVIRSIYVY